MMVANSAYIRASACGLVRSPVGRPC
jgi:hypothetical protein